MLFVHQALYPRLSEEIVAVGTFSEADFLSGLAGRLLGGCRNRNGEFRFDKWRVLSIMA